jgi:cystathionine gamma-synthase
MQGHSVDAHVLSLLVYPENKPDDRVLLVEEKQNRCGDVLNVNFTIYIVLFPAEQISFAYMFWNYTGVGISVRQANYYLSMLGRNAAPSESDTPSSIEDWSLCADGFSAKQVLRRRIASGLLHYDSFGVPQDPNLKGQQDSPDIVKVSECDVFLFPTGMTAVWSAHQLALQSRPVGKCVCFGFVPRSIIAQ